MSTHYRVNADAVNCCIMLSCYAHKSFNDLIKHTINYNVIYLAEEKKNIVSVTICFQIIIIYAQSVHSGLDVTSWLIETLTIN